ncbi:unnamed protein product [Urochloa humidicola]
MTDVSMISPIISDVVKLPVAGSTLPGKLVFKGINIRMKLEEKQEHKKPSIIQFGCMPATLIQLTYSPGHD